MMRLPSRSALSVRNHNGHTTRRCIPERRLSVPLPTQDDELSCLNGVTSCKTLIITVYEELPKVQLDTFVTML
jgi:hypothetical protein